MKGLVFLTLIGFVAPVRADNKNAALPSVTFGPFPIQPVRTRIWFALGTPASKADKNTPFPKDFPPSVTVSLEDARPYPAYKKGPRYFFPGRNLLRVYQIDDALKAPYETIQPQLKQLQTLLKTRPATAPSAYEQGDGYGAYQQLPDYPSSNSGHLIQLKLEYLDAPWGSGLFYIAQFTQGPGNAPNNEELTYLFQGLSNDGKLNVSADFRVTHPRLPRGIDRRGGGSAAAEIATRWAEALLPKQTDESFSPSLRKLRQWVAILEVK